MPTIMSDHISPNPDRLSRLNEQVRERLHRSLHHLIFDVFGQDYTVTVTQADLHRAVLAKGKFPNPVIFALHGVLLDAALRQDPTHVPKSFQVMRDALAGAPRDFCGMRVSPLSEAELSESEIWLLQRAFADDIGLTTNLSGPSDTDLAASREVISEAVGILESVGGGWAEELRLLASQVYLGSAGTGDKQLFVGAAVFDAYGAVLLNPFGLQSLASTLMALIHESSHQQVFLLHLDDPIILNAADERYSSPLRVEPRPMEGIFHAMWVSARMVLASGAVLTSDTSAEWHEELARQKSAALRAFRDCEQTVAAHAKLTDFGQELFQSARRAIDAA